MSDRPAGRAASMAEPQQPEPNPPDSRRRKRRKLPAAWRIALRRWLDLPETLRRDRLLAPIAPRWRRLKRLMQWGRRPEISGFAPVGPGVWPGLAERGQEMLDGRFLLAGRSVHRPDPFWTYEAAGPYWLAGLHGFEFLPDLSACGAAGASAARDTIESWLRAGTLAGPIAQAPATRGRRLSHWLQLYGRLEVGAAPEFLERLRQAIIVEADALELQLPGGLAGSEAIAAIKGLLLAGLAAPEGWGWRGRAERLLERELTQQILADGGHIERSPSRHLAVLRDLTDLALAYGLRGQFMPPALTGAIGVMAPILRLFQHGDGALALFNDANEETAGQIELVLAAASIAEPQPLVQAPAMGFQRLAAGKTVILVDSGRPSPPGYDLCAHAGSFAFELSVGRERLIVNCGAHAGDPDWHEALRATAAHSTLTLDDTNSSLILPGDGLALRPSFVSCKREERENAIWLDLAHDGYGPVFGLQHRRRFFLSANGEDLRGEDRLTGSANAPYALRFHLHPEVKATMMQSGRAALLRLPKGGGWRLRCDGGQVALQDSVYLGKRGEIRRSQQLVMTGEHEGGETILRWALAREVKRKEKPAG